MKALHVCSALATALLAALVSQGRAGAAPDDPSRRQTDRPGAAAAIPRDEGVVRGRVVDARTGRVIAGAVVRLQDNPRRQGRDGPIIVPSPWARETGAAQATVATQVTDARGRFEFERVMPDVYGVVVKAPGYLIGYFGYSSASRLAIPVDVRGGAAVSNVDVELIPAGVVSGRVLSDTRQGLPGVQMELIREQYAGGGAPGLTLTAVAIDKTDSNGAFRIDDVPPGQYLLRADTPGNVQLASPADAPRVYAPTYYPGVTHLDQAQRVIVSEGQELVDVELAVAVVPSYVISGRVLDRNGSPIAASIQVTLLSGVNSLADLGQSFLGTVGNDGRFEVRNRIGGDYLILVNGGVPSLSWAGVLHSRTINVDRDIRDLEIRTEAPARVEGRIVQADGKPVPFDASALEIVAPQQFGGGYYSPGETGRQRVQSDGTFDVHAAAGQVTFNIRNLPSPWVVKAVRLNGTVVTDETVTVTGGSSNSLEVVVSDRPGRLRGQVTDRGRPSANVLILLFPDDPRLWGVERWTYTTFSEPDGSYAFDRLPSGDYRIVAVNSLPTNAWRAWEALEILRPSSSALRIRDGETRNSTLTLSPIPPGLLEP